MNYEIIRVQLGEEEIILDPSLLYFTESTINDFMEKEAGYYNYFAAKTTLAELYCSQAELEYDNLYYSRFKEIKDLQGCADKTCEANAKIDPDVIKAKEMHILAKYKHRLLQSHLKAYQLAHENAQNRGHSLRKEFDRLHRDPVPTNNYFEDKLDRVMAQSSSLDDLDN